MPHLDSNILSNIYYVSLASQVSRFARNTFGSNTFITLVNQLIKRIQIRGNKHRFMITMLKKVIDKHFHVFNSFAVTADNIIKQIISFRLIYNLFFVCFFVSLFLRFTSIHMSFFFLCFCVLTFFFNLYILETIILYIHDISLFLIFFNLSICLLKLIVYNI